MIYKHETADKIALKCYVTIKAIIIFSSSLSVITNDHYIQTLVSNVDF